MDHNDDVSATKESKPDITKRPTLLECGHRYSTQYAVASWELTIPQTALQRVFSLFISPIKNLSNDCSMLLSSLKNISVFFERIFNTFINS